MKKYHVCFKSTDGDCHTVWTFATSEEDAVQTVQCQYWDISEIIEVY